jgi:hypothetical protein
LELGKSYFLESLCDICVKLGGQIATCSTLSRTQSSKPPFLLIQREIFSSAGSRKLSYGFFSKDTQKRLVGKDTEVPIYEAKMTRDTRLVYTIDCIPEPSGDVCEVPHSQGWN